MLHLRYVISKRDGNALISKHFVMVFVQLTSSDLKMPTLFSIRGMPQPSGHVMRKLATTHSCIIYNKVKLCYLLLSTYFVQLLVACTNSWNCILDGTQIFAGRV